MNKNIDLTKILENCPEGTEFWSDNYGAVQFKCINKSYIQPIFVRRSDGYLTSYTKEGWCNIEFSASCLLWPSKDCRDWSKFTAPWYKHEEKKETKRFDPKTLNVFDKVLARVYNGFWFADFVSVPGDDELCDIPCLVGSSNFNEVVPYNDETKHLLGTADDAPEYYQYVDEDDEWEDND